MTQDREEMLYPESVRVKHQDTPTEHPSFSAKFSSVCSMVDFTL